MLFLGSVQEERPPGYKPGGLFSRREAAQRAQAEQRMSRRGFSPRRPLKHDPPKGLPPWVELVAPVPTFNPRTDRH